MKITVLAVILLAFAAGVAAQKDIKLEVNSTLPDRYAKLSKGMTATAASQVFPFVELTIKKIDYTIAFDGKTKKIKYIFTNDDNFIDGNGRRVDEEITVEWEDIEVLPYFQLRTKPDRNGWQAVIGNSFSFNGDFLERTEKAGKLATEIEGFAKGYNY